MAAHLARDGVRYDLVLCSSAHRARQTLERMASVLGTADVSIEDELYAASADELLARLQRLSDPTDTVLLVAHNPGLQDLATELASGGTGLDRLQNKFPTCSLATLSFDAPWRDLTAGRATLAGYVTPRDLR